MNGTANALSHQENQGHQVRTDLSSFAPRSQWSGLGAVAVVETRVENRRTGEVSTERRSLITSLRPRALANRELLHWRLDVLMGEDARRARSGEAAANLAVLRKITLNTLKLYPPLPGKKGQAMSIRSRHYGASIQPNYLASLLKNPALSN